MSLPVVTVVVSVTLLTLASSARVVLSTFMTDRAGRSYSQHRRHVARVTAKLALSCLIGAGLTLVSGAVAYFG